ncbi:stage III sporulation protein AA [Tepidibacter formicigenes]|jgi:stage III sporulation protein AA|uniref:Stage III sporulation protein AA n=1 Tax=Tepidibacter formicigenes DSM 15518 TaxID=1123349 RepID=A0A1M6L3K9_9FIRM|nr:stage III sporulation protein AA [Tepidibacter formicigenes]SHJ65777.1 stage III sporulation protein AA [Tepidibacter formicigenes DSM 15518]
MNKLPEEIINSLSTKIKECLLNVRGEFIGDIEEIRLRINRPLMICANNKDYFLNLRKNSFDICDKYAYIVRKEDIEQTFQLICRYSIHSFLDDIKKGFITIRGGHRVGIGGKVIIEENNIKNIKHISSLNIRISKEVLDCSKKVIKYIIKPSKGIHNTLIISPPQCGKTTLLRDIVKNISNGIEEYNFEGVKVAVIDERNEIAGSYLGVPQRDIGTRTDIIESCPKDIGIMMLLRSMSPNVIVTDEIGNSKEIKSLYTALNGGVGLITSVHGYGIEDIQNRKELNTLLDKELFKRVIVLSSRKGPGTVEKIYDLEEKRCIFVN